MNISYQEWLNSLDNFHIQTILAELIENPSLEIYCNKFLNGDKL